MTGAAVENISRRDSVSGLAYDHQRGAGYVGRARRHPRGNVKAFGVTLGQFPITRDASAPIEGHNVAIMG